MSMLQPPKGMKDYLPEEMGLFDYVFSKIRKTYESYGFERAETPALEYAELLEGKYGEEEKLIYKFEDKGGRMLALRYDLTAPLARLVATNPALMKPFKRYSIGRAWRYDNPQKGRYREFYQCDVDIVGSKSVKADAEVVACAYDAMKALGFRKVTVKINSRKMMEELLGFLNVKNRIAVFRAIDKLEKIGAKGVEDELKRAGIERVGDIMELMKIGSIGEIERKFGRTEGTDETRELIKYLKIYNVKYTLDLSLVRGLDYYTGPIFEVCSEFGSLAGGGRYDRLIGIFTGTDIPATGISLGANRIVDLMKKEGMFPKQEPAAQIMVISIGKTEKDAERIAGKLRQEFSVETDVMGRSTRKQMEYANKRGIPVVVFMGEKEVLSKKALVKVMKTGKEFLVKQETLAKKIGKLLE